MTRPLARPSGTLGVRALVGATVLWGLVATAGCPGTLDPSLLNGGGGTGGTGASVCNAAATVIGPNCGIPGCHGSTAPSSGLNLTPMGIVARLLDKAPTSSSQLCSGNTTPYLKSGSNPATGLLLQKISSSPPPCGDHMPAGVQLADSDMTCVNDWATAVTTGVITQ